MDSADYTGWNFGPLGKEAAELRSGHAVAIQQYEFCPGGENPGKSLRAGTVAVFAGALFCALGHELGGGLRSAQSGGRDSVHALCAGSAEASRTRGRGL